jgi:hypothetical protein
MKQKILTYSYLLLLCSFVIGIFDVFIEKEPEQTNNSLPHNTREIHQTTASKFQETRKTTRSFYLIA